MIVAIAGAGTMGHALALVHALGGCEVRLQDISEETLAIALQRIETAFDLLVESGMVTPAQSDTLARIRTTTRLDVALEAADLFVETVPEDAKIKAEVYATADTFAPEATIFASNTSFLDVFPLIPKQRLPRAFAVHWYSPPYVIDLVDIAPSPVADPALGKKLVSLYKAMGKTPVLFKKFVPGYVANRIQAAISREVFHMLDNGLADIQQIDESLRHGIAGRMAFLGHLMRTDFAGLPLVQKNLAGNAYALPPETSNSTTLDKIISMGDIGIATGRGFYDYLGRDESVLARARDQKMLALKRSMRAIGPIEAKPLRS